MQEAEVEVIEQVQDIPLGQVEMVVLVVVEKVRTPQQIIPLLVL